VRNRPRPAGKFVLSTRHIGRLEASASMKWRALKPKLAMLLAPRWIHALGLVSWFSRLLIGLRAR
jgi:hypothetical protein